MSQAQSTATDFLESHPKLLGALFMMLVLLSSSGAASGAVAASNAGL